ncbi:MAG: epoxyqueuosine reductase QueH [Marinifilaceae bacterium]|nr:epoxyqueuosine reductase QueH [Marinifilaceae bacterium]
MEKIVLHTCCAPCASAIIEYLLNQQIEPIIYYCNPNIYPIDEYEKRKGEITRHAEQLGLTIIDDDYNHEEWQNAVKGLECEPERGKRCLECFKYRLNRTAEWAVRNGYETFTTTLASSRWKLQSQIDEAGLQAEQNHPGSRYWNKNWRKGGLSERRSQLIKELGFYNQTYCGCEYSMKKP